uniref:Cadherin domain-containing protein n=1 Tax=Globodera rostochiensis TaxID=31243 RepID=A0A914HR26_GLORO
MGSSIGRGALAHLAIITALQLKTAPPHLPTHHTLSSFILLNFCDDIFSGCQGDGRQQRQMAPPAATHCVSAVNEGLCGEQNGSSPSSTAAADDKIQYWLEGYLSELFKLDPVNGMLCTKKELNVERHGNNIQLKAIAKHSDGSEADAQVIVRLEDVNNHSPVFQPREYALQLSPDMLQPFVPLLRVRAVDMDSSSVSIHYRLGDGVGTELFELDEFDGVLMLTERGTRKLGTTEENGGMMYGLELRVEAADDGGRTSEQLALINVRFVPSRLRCVSFADRIFHFHVSEETLPGIAIGNLRLIDVADEDKVLLEIVDDNDSARLFKFDETNAHKLLLETELDSDVAGGEAHLLNVKAIDTAKNCSNLTQILITVLDVNDNAPKFDVKTASIKLPEDFPIHKAFYAVRATDRDRNENGKITYELFQTDPPSVPVQINSNSGILSLSAPLDADSAMFGNNSILLRIRARDHGIPPRHDDMELYMTILDVNDNAPFFDVPEYEIEVPEDAELMSIVHRLNAKDADITVPNRRVRYSINQILPMIEEGANSSVLGINKWTGEIFLREPLDREQYAQFAFEVEARDGGIPSRMARARLHMRVQDVNDNAPACTQQQIVHVQARGSGGGVQAGDLVGRVQATDPDEGSNGTVRFRMQQPNEWFELNSKGDLYLRRPIDAANLSSHARSGAAAAAAGLSLPRSFTLIAEDQSVEMPLSSVCQVMEEEASGRHAVRLLGPVQTELWLNAQTPVGTPLMQVNASGVRRWSIRPDDPLAQLFSISSDGTIRLAKRLAEGHESFVLAGGTKQSITIQMDPVGNSAPKLLTVVLRRNEYGGGGNFGGSEFPPATITVAEDWSIRWQKPLYTVEKRPKNWTDHMFFRLTAVGDESEKALEIGLFELDELSGALYMAKFPGPNCADEFVFHVMARSLSDQFVYEKDVQLLTINLANLKRNANRRSVRCAKMYQQWNVSESAQIGTFVGRVNILDSANEISTLKFRFNNASSSTPAFRVDESDGSLYVRKALDWHTMPTSILLVEVSATTFDEVSQATVTRCAIRVNVQTDASRTTKSDIRFLSVPNVTIFLANLEQGLYPEGNVVHHFVAISERLPENRALFEIAGGNGLGAFRLESDGALSVPEPSKFAANGGSSIFRLTIRANLNMATMTSNNNKMHRNTRVEQHFIVRIDQSHRKFSYFAKRHFVAEILTDESFAMGRHQFVAKFKRQDNANCALFELMPSPEGFKMNGEDGILEYVAMENGTEALLKAGHNLTLTVLARRCCINSSLDNANYEPAETIDHAILTIVPRRSIAGPKIEPTSCGNVSVPENEAIRQLLRVRVLLDDDERAAADGASPSSVVYAIEGGHWHTNLFTIDPGTGWIGTGALDREQKQEHLLMVSATDLNSLPKKADMCTVFITVIDRNDNAPVFDPSNAEQIDLLTTASVGHKLAQLEAKDADQGENGQIRYVMASDPSGMFDVGWQTGELTFARESAFISEQSGVWVVLKAVDRGHPKALESEPKRVRISWERRKSHGNGRPAAPLAFTRQQHAVDVPEGRPRGQFVAQLDLLNRNNSSSPVSYSILPSGNDDFAFSVDAGGKVSTALELDAEIRRHYALQIVAIDASGRQRADTRLDVHLQDANDNAPFIAQQDGPIRLMEDLPMGSLVSVVSATDADIGPTLLQYSLGDVSSEHFEINRWNGKVHLKHKLDYEKAAQHILRVYVTDGINRASANLSVEVLDVNDNVPRFVEPYIDTELSQDAPIGHVLAKVEAIDGDGPNHNAQLRYEFVNNAGQNSSTVLDWLHCDTKSGELRLRNILPQQQQQQIGADCDRLVVVKATDGGQPPLFAYCTVRITVVQTSPARHNANNNVPMFAKLNYTFTLPENVPMHLPIGRLTMRQLPTNALLNCDFQLSYPQDGIRRPKFRVNFDGQIFVEDLLDREMHGEWLDIEATVGKCPPQRNDISTTTTPTATAFSTRQSAKVGVRIHLVDINDNVPKFDEETNAKTLWISDSVRLDTVLTRFNATDGDASEENSRLSYHLLAGNNFDLFKLDMASGELRIVRWDDAFALAQIGELSPVEELLISAHDNGTPWQSAEWSVGVRMDWDGWKNSALDDRMFSVYADARRVPQHADNGTDGQRSAQTHCSYTIEPTDASSSLSLNETIVVEPTTGDITLIAPLDLETAAATANMFTESQQQQQQQLNIMLHFNVSCTDAVGKIVATVPVEMYVYGVDEFAPTFTKSAYTFKLPPNVDLNKPIGQVVAIDRDIGYGSTVRYSLDPADAVSAQYVQIAADQGVLGMLRQPSTVGGTTPNGTASGETRVLRFTVWAESGWAYGNEQHRMRSSATVYIEFGDFTTSSNPSLAGADHSLLSSFDLLSLLVLPTLFLCFCLLSVLVLARLLLRSGRSAAKSASGGNFLQPAAPKKRMFSVATCRELQQHAAPDAAGAPALLSPSFESGLFSYVKRTPPMRTGRVLDQSHAAPSVVPSSCCSSSSNYVNMAQHRTASRLAANAAAATAGSRRSAPDSGIDPDARSLASEDSCAVADAFLAALGVVEEMPPRHKGNAKSPPAPQLRHQQQTGNDRPPAEDAFLDELIYACMDEIVPVQQQQHQQQQLQTARAGARSCSSSSSTFVPHQSTDNIGRTERENQTPFLLTISKRLIEMDAPQKLDPKNGSRV